MFLLKKEELRLQERAIRLKEEKEEKEFMFMDTSILDEDGQEYICRRKKKILESQKEYLYGPKYHFSNVP